MSKMIAATKAICEVNTVLDKVFKAELNPNNGEGNGTDIRFDLPETDTPPSHPTVSIFLYDIHEDLQLRSAESRRYSPASGTLSAGWVNVSFNYLITYWEPNKSSSDGSNPDSQPNSQAAKVMSQVMSVLINNRQLAEIPGAYTKVIPPQENLNSLGNFWQALGNRPRLSLMYSITIPVSLETKQEAVAVTSLTASVEQKALLKPQAMAQALWQSLCQELGGTEDIRLALSKVEFLAEPAKEASTNTTEQRITVQVKGVTRKGQLEKINATLSGWVKGKKPVATVGQVGLLVVETLADNLVGI